MTKEEAIQILADLIDSPFLHTWEKQNKALHMAIEALSVANLKEEFGSADAVQGEWIEKYNGNGWNDFWDYTCSNCGKKYERADAVLYHANYCPNCGARMTPYKGGAE